jgi:thioredoxin 1
MKKLKLSIKAKQTPSVVFLILSVAFFVFLFVFKNKLTEYASQLVKSQSSINSRNTLSFKVDSAFNYRQNNLDYKVTFLEFGATGCSACKRMETVMREIKSTYTGRVNVIFLNVLLPGNQELMKFYGIAAIPTQVLLNEEGKEFFRHTGFYSSIELSEIIKQKIKQ